MRLILLTHPASFGSESMTRFAGMIANAMGKRGHEVDVWTSPPKFSRLSVKSAFIRKWLGYADQFVLYPNALRRQIERQPHDTVFVITDQALGMWVPALAARPHVIHCHDFLALKSARGEFPEQPTSWTGQQYQRLIHRGFSHGNAFISVSEKTRDDLHHFLPTKPSLSAVVYNGLNYPFRPMDLAERLSFLKQSGVEVPAQGFVVHVGGNLWYKNRLGVLKIYRAFAAAHPNPPELWLIGTPPTKHLSDLAGSIPRPGKVRFLSGLSNDQVNAAYAHAGVLLFPSLEEGFGWPIAEAMAVGCPVITTDFAPMTEVAGPAARLIPRMPPNIMGQETWAKAAAEVLTGVLNLDASDRAALSKKGKSNAARFDTEMAMTAYEQVYSQALREYAKSKPAPPKAAITPAAVH